MSNTRVPAVEFYSIYRNATLPGAASSDMIGSMPSRAAQLCLPLRTASGAGFYLYPPIDFALRWDGVRSEITWLDSAARVTEWIPLDGGVEVHAPGASRVPSFVCAARQSALERVIDLQKGVPFINAHPSFQNQVEITAGLVARTSPGWGLLVRPVANPAANVSYQVLDGYLETDWYRSFLPVVLRLGKPGQVVRFFRHLPLAQLVPMPHEVMERRHSPTRGEETRGGIGLWPDDIWSEFIATRSERFDPQRQSGTYARASKRARPDGYCPFGPGGERVS